MMMMIQIGWDEELAGEPVNPLLWAWPLPVHLALNELHMWDRYEQPGTFKALVLETQGLRASGSFCTGGRSDPSF